MDQAVLVKFVERSSQLQDPATDLDRWCGTWSSQCAFEPMRLNEQLRTLFLGGLEIPAIGEFDSRVDFVPFQ